jgi:hypothetical protein
MTNLVLGDLILRVLNTKCECTFIHSTFFTNVLLGETGSFDAL